MVSDAPTTRSLVLYGPHLFPPRLRSILGAATPVSSSAVYIPNAWLTFDVPGVPFLEPVYANALVRGVNDQDAFAGEEKEKDGGSREERYSRWVWGRACPGMQFEGELPPSLEGIVYELTDEDYQAVVSSAAAAFPSSSASLVLVHCTKFANGDPAAPTGEVIAELLVAKPPPSSDALQPSQNQLRLVIAGALLSALSRPYIAYLSLLRPFIQTSSPSKALAVKLFRLLLLPSFILFHLPSKLLGLPAWAAFGRLLTGRGVNKLRGLERWMRGSVGSGYINEDDHKAAQTVKL
ncbi:hypothetical protein JCM6882_005388 [Rhodosporidiobolus microsporus]